MTPHSTTINAPDMLARYKRAQYLMQGTLTKRCVFNATLIPHWIGDSDCFWYEREFRQGKEFRLVNAFAGTNEIAFDHIALAKSLEATIGETINADDLPISKIDLCLSPLQVVFDALGKRWTYTDSNQSCTESEPLRSDWIISPDDSKAAFLRNNNIWVRDLGSGDERALTDDGEMFYCYASAPMAWGMNVSTGALEALWSPDSKRLFTLQVDTRQVKSEPIMQYLPQDGSLRPSILNADRRVAHPGDEHVDEYRFLSIEVATGQQQDANYHRCPVFRNGVGFLTTSHGWWSQNSRHAYFIDVTRGGDRIARLVEFDTHTGFTRILIEEECPDTCFKLRLDSRNPIHVRPLLDSNEVLWFSERSGWGHLYLYDLKTGQLKHQITEGDWLVRDIHQYDSERRELIIQTAGRIDQRDAYYRDICRVNIDSGELTPIISTDHEFIVLNEADELGEHISGIKDAWRSAGVSPTGNYVVSTRSRVDDIPVSLLFDRDGKQCMELEVADVTGLPDGWQWPERIKLLAADGKTDVYAVIYRPTDFSPDQSYPVLDNSMTFKDGNFFTAGSFTNDANLGCNYLSFAAMAELGFIVVDIAGRGTSNRHRAFSASASPELPSSDHQADRIIGIQQMAKRYPYMDLNRVGAGGSPSSNVAISGLLGAPDFYKVGVCNAPIADLRHMPAFFGEAFNNFSAASDTLPFPHGYAKNLKGKLLLIHGILNPAVSVANSFSLVEVLHQANKDFDMLLLPNDGFPTCSYTVRRSWDYLVKYLMGVEPPQEFELITGMDILFGNVVQD